jgi:hypothetical protein
MCSECGQWLVWHLSLAGPRETSQEPTKVPCRAGYAIWLGGTRGAPLATTFATLFIGGIAAIALGCGATGTGKVAIDGLAVTGIGPGTDMGGTGWPCAKGARAMTANAFMLCVYACSAKGLECVGWQMSTG